jgi:hypothetical protein
MQAEKEGAAGEWGECAKPRAVIARGMGLGFLAFGFGSLAFGLWLWVFGISKTEVPRPKTIRRTHQSRSVDALGTRKT